MKKALGLILALPEQDIVPHVYDSSTQEVEAGGSEEAQGQRPPRRKFEDRLEQVRSCFQLK